VIQAASEYFFIVLLGVFAIVWIVRARWAEQTPAPLEQATTEVTPASVEPGTLSTRLHELDAQFAAFASNSAHPRELDDQPAFKQAVELLADPAVALNTVMQYAHGVSWTLACAALAALTRREDRAEMVDAVAAQFDKLAPWAMYFALEYFLNTEPKPTVGAVVVGAKDWWKDSPILPLLVQDYFDRRVIDEPEFGPDIYTPAAAPLATIRAFLDRLNAPMAAALTAKLDAIERLNLDRAFLTSFGRFWTDQTGVEFLVEIEGWRHLDAVQAAVCQTPVRSLLVSGERLVGKTAFLQLVARRLAAAGWTVFEAGAPTSWPVSSGSVSLRAAFARPWTSSR